MRCGDCKELNQHFGLAEETGTKYCCNKYGTMHTKCDYCEVPVNLYVLEDNGYKKGLTRHAHWIAWEEISDSPYWYKCSCCGEYALFDDRVVMYPSKYCPNCGSLMDEKIEYQ